MTAQEMTLPFVDESTLGLEAELVDEVKTELLKDVEGHMNEWRAEEVEWNREVALESAEMQTTQMEQDIARSVKEADERSWK